jgi:hypothetical protein
MFNTYLPYVSSVTRKRGVGVSQEYTNEDDLTLLGASWWFDWDAAEHNFTGIEYVPMSWSGNMIETTAKNILVFNEPDNREQANLRPNEAASRYGQLVDRYGVDRLIVGGWTYWGGWSWVNLFMQEVSSRGLPMPTRWHCHGYCEWGITPKQLVDYWTDCHDLTGGTYWITEFGDPFGNLEAITVLPPWMESTSWIERYSAFTTRITGGETWYPSLWPKPAVMALVDDNGLTEIGGIYSGR